MTQAVSTKGRLEQIEAMLVKIILGEDQYQHYLSGAIPTTILLPYVKIIQSLSQSYTKGGPLPTGLKDRRQTADAYSLYYFVLSYVKLSSILQRLNPAFSGYDLKILDYGCGPGSGSLACLDFFNHPLHLTLVDKSKEMLSLAEKTLAGFNTNSPKASWESRHSNHWQPTDKYQLILMANVLNEIPVKRTKTLLLDLCSNLEEDGLLLLLEPALFTTTRSLMEFRDFLIEEDNTLTPLFPCTHCNPCPMLKESTSDWCHDCITWERPRLLRQLDQLAGFNKHRIKYSSIVFQKGGAFREGLRVVSIPERKKYAYEACLCGQNRYGKVTLPKAAASKGNAAFKKIGLYERMQIDELGEDLIIQIENQIKILSD